MEQKNISKMILIGALILTILLAGCTGSQASENQNSGTKVTLFKSPSCGCCTGHAAELKSRGFDVEVIPTENMYLIKQQYNIPSDMESCHTAIIGDYFVEGHMPAEAINKLLEEQPDIDGIALPDMPAGSPGMPGRKTESFVIYSVKDKKTNIFTTV